MKLFTKLIDKKLKQATMVLYRRTFDRIANQTLSAAKANLANNITSHPVSQEIMGGPDGGSLFLKNGGNLFSFLGFDRNRKPIAELIEYLETNIQIIDEKEVIDGGSQVYKTYTVKIPKFEDMASSTLVTLHEWEPTNPWPFSIEKFIVGYDRFYKKDAGRSGGGVQAAGPLPSIEGEFQGIDYISPLLRQFKADIVLNAQKGNLFTFK